MSGDFYTLPTINLRVYIALCARIGNEESSCDDTSLDDFLTCVNISKLTGVRFNTGTSEGVRTRKKPAAESYFGGLGFAYVTTSTNKVFKKQAM